MSVREGLSDRLLLDALAAELARSQASGQRPGVLLIGAQACATVSEANGLAGADRVRLLHLDGAAGGLGCGLGNGESLYDADADVALPAGTFGVVCLNVEAVRSYRVLREVTIWAAARVAPGGCLLLAGPRKGGAEVAAAMVRPLAAQLDLLTYRKGHRAYRATHGAPLIPQPATRLPLSRVRERMSMEAIFAPRHGEPAQRRGPVLRGRHGSGLGGAAPQGRCEVSLRGQTLQLVQDDRIFARGQVDPATRLLAETFAAPPGADLLDLGCGNGVLGILAALLDPTSRCTLVDADPLAVAAARRGAELSGAANVTVHLSNVLAALPGQTFDTVVMNPPFHRGRREDRTLGEQFVRDGAAALRQGGQLWVVCNRFLPYERMLRPLLREVSEVAGDRAYKVLRGTRDAPLLATECGGRRQG